MKKQVRKSFLLFSWLLFFLFAFPFSAGAAMYAGQISTGDYLFATGGWAEGSGSTLSWTASDEDPSSNYWTYTYTFTVPQKEISHVIIQVSDDFLDSNIKGISPVGAVTELGLYDESNGNPGMPSSIHGLKWDNLSGLTYTFSITTDKAPMWGNFYAKDGVDNGIEVHAFNTGFGTDPDQGSPWANGPLIDGTNAWLLVPDTQVPIPASVLLLGSGLIGFIGLRKKLGRG